jgi:peptidoglycan/xylan/chitin deacetylase (PgdA/CDA1 family)
VIRVLALACAVLLSACSAPTYTLGRETITSSRPFDKPILLTIDDGPSNAGVDQSMLATLAAHNAKAVWFVNCRNFDQANPHAQANLASLRQIVAAGGEIASHGYSHLHLDQLHGEALRHEIEGCSAAIAAVTGKRPRLFRPPWGVSSPEADAQIAQSGMQKVLWTLNTYDSMLPSFKRDPKAYGAWLAQQDMGATAGDVLLMHDYPHTARNLDAILSALEAQGFHFVMPTRR